MTDRQTGRQTEFGGHVAVRGWLGQLPRVSVMLIRPGVHVNTVCLRVKSQVVWKEESLNSKRPRINEGMTIRETLCFTNASE